MQMGEQFALARKSRGLTVSEAAVDIVSVAHLEQFEHGDYDMPVDDLQALLTRLGISLRQFANYCERREFNQNILPENVMAAEIARDAPQLKVLYRLAATRGNTRTDRLGMMMAATAYANLTGKDILPRAQLQAEATSLLDNASWNRADLMTLRVLVNTLDCTRIFSFCREILAGIPAKLRWNFALANESWYAVIVGCQVLGERDSSLGMSLIRDVARGPRMPETMIRNRLYANCVRSVIALKTDDSEAERARLNEAISGLQLLGAEQVLHLVQIACRKILREEINV
ncbi:helix-turn-helix transcriptional regulator [Lacticaseibacillus pabuli]|uniref:Helix-turn-helix transcriptional regulator n=1 Tax=Lacticaseibacillus pabuli TaxID=3025672 RepID=A0ABY7WT85_9LACO|nr:helix-turn-helix transcriptional regulator [Lacticaseibacillus sp. KACC 23028]WDF83014.1 helix-turn-helix transcriptional regulator [Lacticaseibacillus sp. KACC 23028]